MYTNISGPLMKEHAMVISKQNTCPGAEQEAQGCLRCAWLIPIVKHGKNSGDSQQPNTATLQNQAHKNLTTRFWHCALWLV